MSWQTESEKVGKEPFQYIEADLDSCLNDWGVAPCTAGGDIPCFNTLGSCQDVPNYNGGSKTYRFSDRAATLPVELDAFPFLDRISYAPTKITPGEGIGTRESVTITLYDSTHSDRGIDPYLDERKAADPSYDPASRGTFFGKLKARNLYYKNRPIRIYEGFLTSPFSASNFKVRHYVIDTIDGPDANGKVTIRAKDILKLADDDHAKCPAVSTGSLAADIDESSTTLTFASNAEAQSYKDTDPRVAIGDEVIALGTVSGSTIINCVRGISGLPENHSAGDKVQSCKTWTDVNIREIARELLEDFTGTDPAFIPLAKWNLETSLDTFNLTACIPEPTGVNSLLGELCNQFLIAIFWEEVDQEISLILNTPWVEDVAILTEGVHIIEGSVKPKERHDLRVSQVWFYFNPVSPFDIDESKNFRNVVLAIDPEKEGPDQFDSSVVKEIFSRWVDAGGSDTVDVSANRMIDRFSDTPVEVSWRMPARYHENIRVGSVVAVESRWIQDLFGDPAATRLQVIERKTIRAGHEYEYTGLVYQGLPSEEPISIDTDQVDFNLWNFLSQPPDAVEVEVIIEAGVFITGDPAFDEGDFHPDSFIEITNNGFVYGNGGLGGYGGGVLLVYDQTGPGFWTAFASDGADGTDGKDAFRLTVETEIDNTNGEIFGGGGGGGGGGSEGGKLSNGKGGGGGGGGQGAGTCEGGTAGQAREDPPDGFAELEQGVAGEDGSTSGPGLGGTEAIAAGNGGPWGQPGTGGVDGVEKAHDQYGDGGDGGDPGQGGYAVRLATAQASIVFTGGNNSAQVKGQVG